MVSEKLKVWKLVYKITEAGITESVHFQGTYNNRMFTYVIPFSKRFHKLANKSKGQKMRIYATLVKRRIYHMFFIGSGMCTGDEKARLQIADVKLPREIFRAQPKRIRQRRMAVDERDPGSGPVVDQSATSTSS